MRKVSVRKQAGSGKGVKKNTKRGTVQTKTRATKSEQRKAIKKGKNTLKQKTKEARKRGNKALKGGYYEL